jgi:hypothetical protein
LNFLNTSSAWKLRPQLKMVNSAREADFQAVANGTLLPLTAAYFKAQHGGRHMRLDDDARYGRDPHQNGLRDQAK